jgi:RecJ-like exonuclease
MSTLLPSPCPRCNGTGEDTAVPLKECDWCNGTGAVWPKRVWLVTARDADGKFIDQRRIEAGRGRAERDAYDWIRSKGGVEFRSTLEEII